MKGDRDIAALVLLMVKPLVDRPDEVIVETVTSETSITYRVSVADGDAGQLIGKQGRIARSLRIILSAAGMKLKTNLGLEIVE
jgi:predicted RNA-binding protein YlqC (UPF0109 family)